MMFGNPAFDTAYHPYRPNIISITVHLLNNFITDRQFIDSNMSIGSGMSQSAKTRDGVVKLDLSGDE